MRRIHHSEEIDGMPGYCVVTCRPEGARHGMKVTTNEQRVTCKTCLRMLRAPKPADSLSPNLGRVDEIHQLRALFDAARTLWAYETTGLGGKLDRHAALEHFRKLALVYLEERGALR